MTGVYWLLLAHRFGVDPPAAAGRVPPLLAPGRCCRAEPARGRWSPAWPADVARPRWNLGWAAEPAAQPASCRRRQPRQPRGRCRESLVGRVALSLPSLEV